MILGIRPEDLEDVSLEPDTPPDRRLRGVAELREALGSELMVHFTVEGTQAALTEDVKELAQDVGAPDGQPALESSGSGALLVGRFGARASVEEGKPVEVAVDTRSLHFFDAETSRRNLRRRDKPERSVSVREMGSRRPGRALGGPRRGRRGARRRYRRLRRRRRQQLQLDYRRATRACRDRSSSGASGPRRSRRRSRR